MRAARIYQFGGPDVIQIDEIEPPRPGAGEVLVRVHAAGVGPWDAWIRSGRSVLPQPLPLTLGSDLSGIAVETGPRVEGIAPGQPIFGAANPQFTGAHAEYAVVRASMIAPRPAALDDAHAAGVPITSVTALQMLAGVAAGQRVLVLGAGGNVGAYAVQLARLAGAHVIGADLAPALAYAASVGAHELVDPATTPLPTADLVIDTVGGDLAVRALAILAPGGRLVSSVQKLDGGEFLLVDVTRSALRTIADHIDRGRLAPRLGSVVPLAAARTAHRMLAGAEPHLPGKIVLAIR